MGNIDPQFYKDHLAGMVTNVNESITPQNSVALALNMDFDQTLGALVSRFGTSIVNAQIESGKTCLGLHNFRDADGSNHKLIAFFNNSGNTQSVGTDVEAGSSITGLTTQTASLKHRMLTFLDSVLIVNGTDAPASYNGATVITTGGAFDLGNIPFSEPSLCIEWLDRVMLAGDSVNPDRVYYSSTPTNSAISWTSGNGFVDIEPEDGGGGIKAFGKVPGFVLIFKERSMKRWNFDSAFPETLIDVGTPSQESVINAGGVCAFFSASNSDSKGFYLTNGGTPQAISHDRPRNIKKWIDAIPQSAEANVAGVGTDRFFMWSVGNLTVDGITYNNVVLRWNRVLDQWSVRSYPTRFYFFSGFVESGSNKLVGGDDDGNVVRVDADGVFVDYSSKPIHYKVLYQEDTFGYSQLKEISEKVIVNSRNMDGARVQIFSDLDRFKEPTDYRDVNGYVSELRGSNVGGHIYQVGISGTVSGARAILKEIEIPNVLVTGNY